jgi:hypothetical protein
MTVPYAFANLSGNIALAKLDSNFNTPITIGNTSVQLGNTINTINNITLANVTITSGTSNVTNVNVTNINVTNVTATLANVTTLNVASEYVTASNVATAVIGNLTLSNALTVPNGGTGRVTLPVNNVLLGNGTGSIASVAPGNAGNVLTSIGGVWVSNAAVVANSVTNVTATSPVISSGGTTPNLSFIASGTAGNVLTSIGGVWVSNAAVTLSAGGSTTQVQYNNAGTLGGISGFTTDGTRVTASTTIGVGGATPSTSGSGITFPAIQSASSDANTLDDYEEGTFTPAFTSLTIVSGTPVYTGFYTKIGRVVYAVIRIQGGASTTAVGNTTYCNNLPFSASTDSTCQATNSANVSNYGVGLVQSNNAFVPSWTAQLNITISMTYQV